MVLLLDRSEVFSVARGHVGDNLTICNSFLRRKVRVHQGVLVRLVAVRRGHLVDELSWNSRGLHCSLLTDVVPALHHFLEDLLVPLVDVRLVLFADGAFT